MEGWMDEREARIELQEIAPGDYFMVRAMVLGLLLTGAREVTIDLQETEEFDPAAVGLLLTLQREVSRQGRRLRLVGAPCPTHGGSAAGEFLVLPEEVRA